METKQGQKKEDTNVIFLIGNGYDLYNGLKTSYKDFIYWYIKKHIAKAVKNSPSYASADQCVTLKINKHETVDFDAENLTTKLNNCLTQLGIKNYLYRSTDEDSFIDFHLNENQYIYISIKPNNTLIENILRNCENSNWNGIEHSIYYYLRLEFSTISNKLESIKNGEYIPKVENIEKLNLSIDCLKKELIEYLLTQNNSKLEKDVLTDPDVINWCWNKDGFSSALFLNFNYTNYIETKLKINLEDTILEEKCKFINIHGDINSESEEVIFGIGDEQEEFFKTIESYFGDEWMYSLKSFYYLKNQKYQDLLGFIAKGDYEIYIVGHSCSITDRTLLKMLFENESCKKIHVMHYKGMESYLKTAYNISRNFDDKIKLRQVLQPFDPKLRLNSEI